MLIILIRYIIKFLFCKFKVYQPISMLCFKSLFNIGRYTMFAYNSRITTCWRSLESCMLPSWTFLFTTSHRLFPFPHWCEIRFTLSTLKRFWRWWNSWFFSDKINYMLQTHQVYKFRIRRIWHEVHLRWRRFRRRYL